MEQRIKDYQNSKLGSLRAFSRLNDADKQKYRLGKGRYGQVYAYRTSPPSVLKVVPHKKYNNIKKKVGAQVEIEYLLYIRDHFLAQNINLGVVWLYDFKLEPRTDYLLLERMDITFWHYLRESRLSKNQVLAIIIQTVFTLAFLQQNIASFRHNDLKLDNILLKRTLTAPKTIRWGRRMTFLIPASCPEAFISDFDYAYSPQICDNPKVTTGHSASFGCSGNHSSIYDLHIFLNSMYSSREHLPAAVGRWLLRVLPEDLCGQSSQLKHGRLRKPEMHRSKLPNARQILADPVFDIFRV